MSGMSSNPAGMAWEAVHQEGDTVLPDGWAELSPRERDAFRDELSEWVSKVEAQPQLFANQGAHAAQLLELTRPPTGWDWTTDD